MSLVEVRERVRDSPARARSLLTVRAAISSALSSERPCSNCSPSHARTAGLVWSPSSLHAAAFDRPLHRVSSRYPEADWKTRPVGVASHCIAGCGRIRLPSIALTRPQIMDESGGQHRPESDEHLRFAVAPWPVTTGTDSVEAAVLDDTPIQLARHCSFRAERQRDTAISASRASSTWAARSSSGRSSRARLTVRRDVPSGPS